jgi:hypothetical protein
VDRAQKACIDAITETIMVDTGVPRAPAEPLAAGLVGAAAASAQFWLAGGRRIEREAAETLLATLAWRGVASFPRHGGAHPHFGTGERDGEAAQPQIGPAVRATRKGTGAIG